LTSIVFSGLFACWAQGAHSQEDFRAWVGLYDPDSLGWLENENRIEELCANRITFSECHAEMLSPRMSTYPLYSAPAESSPSIGELVVVAVPGRGISTFFHSDGSPQAIVFTPDLYLQDWGYGPYHHQTVMNQQLNWFQLPPDPWPNAVWLYRESETNNPTIVNVSFGDIIEMDGSNMFVVATESDALMLRNEQLGDIWCEEGDPPPISPIEPSRLMRAELVDSRGHLSFRLQNLKGC